MEQEYTEELEFGRLHVQLKWTVLAYFPAVQYTEIYCTVWTFIFFILFMLMESPETLYSIFIIGCIFPWYQLSFMMNRMWICAFPIPSYFQLLHSHRLGSHNLQTLAWQGHAWERLSWALCSIQSLVIQAVTAAGTLTMEAVLKPAALQSWLG